MARDILKPTKLLNILSLLFLCVCFVVPQMSQRSMMKMIQCRSQSYSFSRRLHSSPSRSWTSCALTDWSYCNITWMAEVCETGDNPLELRWTTEPNCHNHFLWVIYSNADSFFNFAIIAFPLRNVKQGYYTGRKWKFMRNIKWIVFSQFLSMIYIYIYFFHTTVQMVRVS